MPAEDIDMKESCRLLRRLGDERGDARLERLDGERTGIGGAERGRRDVGEPCPAVGLVDEDDEARGK